MVVRSLVIGSSWVSAVLFKRSPSTVPGGSVDFTSSGRNGGEREDFGIWFRQEGVVEE